MGLDEAYTFSLVPDELVVPLDPRPLAGTLRVDHSSRRREANLRVSLVPSLLAARAYNEAHGMADAALFEIAPVYLPRQDRDLPDEPTHLGIVLGRDFAGLKGVVEVLLDRLHAAGRLDGRPVDHRLFTAGRAASCSAGTARRSGFWARSPAIGSMR